jgi:hypothetical protein
MIAIYFWTIKKLQQNQFSSTTLKKLVIAVAIILAIGYPAFTHDMFNYIFDARILTHYGQNPYQFKALDFPQDDWTRFMHWTHRTYPYGPVWLAITAVPSIIGINKFLITFYLFKGLFLASYLATCFYIYKITNIISKDTAKIATALFAFHPLVIIESVLSPHLDITMIALFIAAVYYFIVANQKNQIKSYILLLLSIGIKFVTLISAPLFIPTIFKRLSIQRWSFFLFLSSLLTVVIQTASQGHLQPWYLLFPLTVLPMLYSKQTHNKVLIAYTIALLPIWIYIYFTYSGQWANVLWFI